ncbi:hypothetical protein E2320_003292, partial [Naja naja]
VIVGAPGEQNSTGKVYQCNLKSQDCEDIPLDGIEQHCDKNLYVSGICYLFDTKLHNPKSITTGYQKCLKGKVDLVFLFDGSASMKTSEFMTIKEFMIDVMKELWNSSVHFAAVQFSEDAKLEFDFNNYTSNPNPEKLLANVVHAEQITNTFKAIKFVADRGHIEAVKKKNILRLIIGIGNHLNAPESQKNLKLIASEPKSQFLKILASFDELKDSFNDLQSNIFAIEADSDRVILGAVGADNWAGGILEQQKDFSGERFITTPSVRKEMEGAYLEFNGDLGYPLGRFGAAITDLADVNGDKQTDVAIGAPLEDGERGAVYIYNSHEKTLLMEYSQRITGASISPGLRYFGQSIHGKTDLRGDGLTSIAVGAFGKVMVLQSRPIVNVATRVTLEPKEIPVKDVECTGSSKLWQNINLKLRICFDNTFATESYTGHLSVKLLFRLEIDPDRVKYRGEFRNGKNILNGAEEISLKPVCVLEEINIMNCIEDYLSPIKVLVNLSLEEDGLSFRKHSVLKFNAVVVLQCDAMLRRQDFQGLACNVSHPIYRNSTKLQFGVLSNVAWKETLEMMAYVTSENEEKETLQNNRALHSIPVKYPINIIVKGLDTSTQYVNFSSKLQENKTVTHSYQDPNVNCQPDDHNKTTRNYPTLTKNWAVDEYLIYKCDLGQINSSTIHVIGMMSIQNKSQNSLQTKFYTALWVEFDTRRYKNVYSHEFAQVQVTEIEVIIMMNYLLIIIGSIFGGLFLLILCIIGLYKCGFFKRTYKQKIELQGEHENAVQAADNLEDGAEKEGSKTEKENQSKLLTEPLNSENETQ